MIELVAQEGKMLTNGVIVCSVAWIGENDEAENWHEIDADLTEQDQKDE